MKIDIKLLVPLILIMVVAVVEQFAIDCYLPAFPSLTEFFHTTNSMVQLSLSIFLAGEALAQPVFGFLSDYHGRRPMLIIGIIIFVLSSILCFTTSNINMFLIGRLIEGLGVGSGIVIARAMAKDIFASDVEFAQIVSALSSIIILIPLASPIAGGYIQYHFGWRYIFILLTIAATLLAVALIIWLPETFPKDKHLQNKVVEVFKPYVLLLKSSVFWTNLLLASFASAIAIIYVTITPFFYQHTLGLSPIFFGWITAVVTIGAALGSILNAKFVGKYGLDRMIFSGILIMLVALVIMLIFGVAGVLELNAVLIPMVFTAIGVGFIAGNTASKALSPFSHIAGGASAIYGGIQFLIFAIVSAGAALVHTNSQIPLALLLLLPTVLIFVINKYGTKSAVNADI